MLKTLPWRQKNAGYRSKYDVQLFIDPARVLDRQVISGEVAADSVVALGRSIEIEPASNGQLIIQGRNQLYWASSSV